MAKNNKGPRFLDPDNPRNNHYFNAEHEHTPGYAHHLPPDSPYNRDVVRDHQRMSAEAGTAKYEAAKAGYLNSKEYRKHQRKLKDAEDQAARDWERDSTRGQGRQRGSASQEKSQDKSWGDQPAAQKQPEDKKWGE